MKRKKIVSSAVAGMLVAAQMMMPVSASSDGGFDVAVDIIKPVIRVQVPTALGVAVNQFEKGDAGSQIKSEEFKITNKSEVPVKVTVESVVELESTNGPSLVATKKEAEESSEANGEVWLAAAAQVSAGKYIADTTKAIRDLTEANKNVATFTTVDSDLKAKQIFYLGTAKATAPATSPAVAYKGYQAGAAKDDNDHGAYVEFYKLTALAGADATAKETNFKTALANTDGSRVCTASAALTTTGEVDLTIVEKGTAYDNSKTYYTVSKDPTKTANIAANDLLLYGETTAEGDKTAFRYIGKLSPEKDSWSNADIKTITINYDIDGISQDQFNAMKVVCPNLGLYESLVGRAAVNGPSVMNNAATPAAITLKTAIVGRLKNSTNSTVQFVLTPAQLLVMKTEKLEVKKVNVKVTGEASATECAVAPTDNPNPAANTDGKLYTITITGLPSGMTSVDYIEVLYGAADATDGPYMTVKYTFQ